MSLLDGIRGALHNLARGQVTDALLGDTRLIPAANTLAEKMKNGVSIGGSIYAALDQVAPVVVDRVLAGWRGGSALELVERLQRQSARGFTDLGFEQIKPLHDKADVSYSRTRWLSQRLHQAGKSLEPSHLAKVVGGEGQVSRAEAAAARDTLIAAVTTTMRAGINQTITLKSLKESLVMRYWTSWDDVPQVVDQFQP